MKYKAQEANGRGAVEFWMSDGSRRHVWTLTLQCGTVYGCRKLKKKVGRSFLEEVCHWEQTLRICSLALLPALVPPRHFLPPLPVHGWNVTSTPCQAQLILLFSHAEGSVPLKLWAKISPFYLRMLWSQQERSLGQDLTYKDGASMSFEPYLGIFLNRDFIKHGGLNAWLM